MAGAEFVPLPTVQFSRWRWPTREVAGPLQPALGAPIAAVHWRPASVQRALWVHYCHSSLFFRTVMSGWKKAE